MLIFQRQLIYLGHQVSAEGIQPDPKMVQAIKEMPAPTNVNNQVSAEGIQPDPKMVQAIKEMPAPTNLNEVRSFLGMCGF